MSKKSAKKEALLTGLGELYSECVSDILDDLEDQCDAIDPSETWLMLMSVLGFAIEQVGERYPVTPLEDYENIVFQVLEALKVTRKTKDEVN